MTTVSILFHNLKNKPIQFQVDPWAGFYVLREGESIEIVAESETSSPSLSLIEHEDSFTVLEIGHSDEYYVVVDGKRVHCSDYLSNIED